MFHALKVGVGFSDDASYRELSRCWFPLYKLFGKPTAVENLHIIFIVHFCENGFRHPPFAFFSARIFNNSLFEVVPTRGHFFGTNLGI